MSQFKKFLFAAVACVALGTVTIGCSQNNAECCGTGDSCCDDTKAVDHGHKHHQDKAVACICPSGKCECDHKAGNTCTTECTATCCMTKHGKQSGTECKKPCCEKA